MMRDLKAVLILLGVDFAVTYDRVIGERIEGNGWDVVIWCSYDRDELELMNHKTEETVQGIKAVVSAILEIENRK